MSRDFDAICFTVLRKHVCKHADSIRHRPIYFEWVASVLRSDSS